MSNRKSKRQSPQHTPKSSSDGISSTPNTASLSVVGSKPLEYKEHAVQHQKSGTSQAPFLSVPSCTPHHRTSMVQDHGCRAQVMPTETQRTKSQGFHTSWFKVRISHYFLCVQVVQERGSSSSYIVLSMVAIYYRYKHWKNTSGNVIYSISCSKKYVKCTYV